jgi:hypothetical protein
MPVILTELLWGGDTSSVRLFSSCTMIFCLIVKNLLMAPGEPFSNLEASDCTRLHGVIAALRTPSR